MFRLENRADWYPLYSLKEEKTDVSVRMRRLDTIGAWLLSFNPDCVPQPERNDLLYTILDVCQSANDTGGKKLFRATVRYELIYLVYEILRYRIVKFSERFFRAMQKDD